MIDSRTCREQGTCQQDDVVNKDSHQHNLNQTRFASKRQYDMMNHNSNIILVSAAIVLLVTSMYSSNTMIAQAFEPSSSIRWTILTPTNTQSSTSHNQVSSLIRHTTSASRIISYPITHLYGTDNKKSQPTWSKAAMVTDATSERTVSRRRESKLGVRRRVKSVLKKARRRTGIRNNSEGEDEVRKSSRKSSIPSVVAEAASIGGLGAVIVNEETGQVDVAFDYIRPARRESYGVEEDANQQDSNTTASANGKAINGASKKKKTSPASTYSAPVVVPEPFPDEALVVASPINATKKTGSKNISTSIAVLSSDVSAAFSLPPPPLPFSLPKLNQEQKALLLSGERVQFQSEMGNEGSGFVVLDVKAPESVVWNCLLDFKSYPETIPTVQNVIIEDGERGSNSGRLDFGKSGTSRATFTLSKKLRLKVSVVHKYKTHPCGDHLIFELDKRSQNFVLNKAKGVWYTESKADGLEPGSTRIWLLAELKVSRILPRMIVDYAARKAFPRATTWIKPHVETAASLWLKPGEK